jgi:membrane-associated protein
VRRGRLTAARVGQNHEDDPLNFLQGLHGVVAVVLLCGLLFAEESGVPLPFAPGEIVLLAAGLLIAAGGLNPLVFIPLAMFACVAGSIVGYSWARLVGEHGLTSLAQRLHQQRNLERVSRRMRSAGWMGVALSRLIPGLRIYTTLVAGALRVPRRIFIAAMVPSTVIWVGVFVALGTVVGIPVEHFFNHVQQLAVQGAILVVMGLGCYLAIRRTPPSTGAGLVRVPHAVRAGIAAAIDLGVIASIVTGLLALGRRLFGVGIGASWLDAVIAMVVAGIIYIVGARRGAGATVGEALLQTSYVSGRQLPRRPQEAWQAARALLAGSPDELRPTADLLRALADPDRLRLVRHLLDQPRTVEELAALTGTEILEVRHKLDRLLHAGVLMVRAEGAQAWSQIRPDLLAPLLEFLSAARLPVNTPPEAEAAAEASLTAGVPE